jgi:hypothetical protein
MDTGSKRKQSYLLRLPLSTRVQAAKIASEEGVSLNHFISLAVAEKLSRMDHVSASAGASSASHQNQTHLVSPGFLHRKNG